MIWNVVASFVFSFVTRIIARRAQRRAQRRARERAADGLAVQVRVSNSGLPIPLVYGHALVEGVLVFADTHSARIAALGSGEADASALGAERRGLGVMAPGTVSAGKNQFLFAQYALCIGAATPINAVTAQVISRAWFDGHEFARVSGRLTDATRAAIPGQARAAVTANIASRTANSRFNGVQRAELYAFFDREEPPWAGDHPQLQVALRGRQLAGIVNGALTAPSFSPNPARVLLDYLLGGAVVPARASHATDEHFGPRFAISEIDLDSFGAAATLIESQSPRRLWEAAFPADFNAALGAGFAKWKDYFQAQGMRSAADDGLAETKVTFPTWALGRYHYDGHIGSDVDYREACSKILDAMPESYLFRALSGKWKLAVPNPDAEPVRARAITDDILVGPVEIEWPDMKDRLNAGTGQYVSIEEGMAREIVHFPGEDTDPLARSLRAQDGDYVLTESLDMEGASNRYHALSRLATHVLTSRRPTFRAEIEPVGLLFEPGDVVPIMSERDEIEADIRIGKVVITTDLTLEVEGLLWVPSDYRFWAGTAAIGRMPDPGGRVDRPAVPGVFACAAPEGAVSVLITTTRQAERLDLQYDLTNVPARTAQIEFAIVSWSGAVDPNMSLETAQAGGTRANPVSSVRIENRRVVDGNGAGSISYQADVGPTVTLFIRYSDGDMSDCPWTFRDPN